MKCSECNQEMTDKQTIEFLKKKIARLEQELMLEKMKAVPYVPYIPYESYRPWWPSDILVGDNEMFPTYTNNIDTAGNVLITYPVN